MAEKKYLDLDGLSSFLTKLRNIFANKTHTHTTSEITDFTDNDTTYTITKSGSTITLTGSDGNKTSVADDNVKQTATTSDAAYPLLLAPSGQTSTATTTSYFDSGVTLNPSTNTVTANITGNAGTATKLAKTKTIQTNLSSTESADFDGSENVTPGVTGTLPITNGGTGATDIATARSNLEAFRFKSSTDAELNNYTVTGVYSIKTSPKTNGAASVPIRNWGTLFVDNTTGTSYQIYIPDGESRYAYKRALSSNTWVRMNAGYADSAGHADSADSATTATTCTGNAATATNLETARKIGLGTGAIGTATSFDGSKDITIPVIEVKEAYLSWGGKNFTGSYGPIDAAMVPDLGANRLAFMPADGVEVQYSQDGGSTWSTYSTATDAIKIDLFNGNGTSLRIGASSATGIDKSNYQLRVIITADIAQVYTVLNKFVIYCSTEGSTGCWCTIDAKTKANVDSGNDIWTTFANKVHIMGWSGYNVINTSDITTYSNNSSQYQKLRFTFGVTSHTSTSNYAGLQIIRIMGFGGVGWGTPSTMARNGHIYTYDHAQNVTFPAKVIATSFKGSFDGTATSAGKLTSSAGNETQPIYFSDGKPVATKYTLNKTVPADAKFTDTTYSDATTSTHGLMSTTDKAKLDKLSLDSNGKISSSNLPSYVDDVLEYNGTSNFPATGETGKIYVDTSSNLTYRWSGSSYVEISKSLALGEAQNTAYRGDRGKIAYNHSQATGNPHGTTIAQIDGLQSALDSKSDNGHVHDYAGSESAGGPANSALKANTTVGIVTSGTGAVYTATVPGIDALTPGITFTMIPHTVSTTTAPKINVNSLGEKSIRMRLTTFPQTTTTLRVANFLSANKPIKLIFDGNFWIIDDMVRPDANCLYGVVPVTGGGTGADNAADARINLGITTREGTTTSGNADYAEVGEWVDGNPNDEDRIGYFVAIDENTAGTTMVKATAMSDVRGVTVAHPAFAGGCTDSKFDIQTETITDEESGATTTRIVSKTLKKQYDYVCVMGLVPVIDNGTCTVNGRCMPTSDGTAVPSPNNMGYQIIERIDDTHVLVAVEPSADMLVRIKTDVTDLQNTKSDIGHVHDVATASKSGFMSANDKSKLDALESIVNTKAQVQFITWEDGD